MLKPINKVSRLLVTALTLSLLLACGNPDPSSPEQQVRDTLAAIELAAEERSLSGVMEHIDDAYQDYQGHTFADLQRMVQIQIIRNQKINIFTHIQSILIDGDSAAVELSAAMAGRSVDLSQESNRLRADTHHFSIVLNRRDNRWLVTSTNWRRGWD